MPLQRLALLLPVLALVACAAPVAPAGSVDQAAASAELRAAETAFAASMARRDLARFGEAMRCEGAFNGHQVVPAAIVGDIRRGSAPAKFAQAGYTLLPGYSYRSMWWVTHNELGAFEARGIHGQRLYVAPDADLVVARFASHPVAASAANDPITLPAFLALGRMLRDR